MRGFVSAAGLVLSLAWAPGAWADCVDFSTARHKAEAAKLAKAPPSAEQLGVPTLAGFTLDSMASTSDPKCDSPRPNGERRVVYTTTLTSTQVLELIHPYLAGERKVDGMNREWFAQPMSSDGSVRLTSGAIMEFPQSSTSANVRAVILAPGTTKPLVKASQPYSIEDMLDGTPWPGGAKGPREFVRADGGQSGYQASSNKSAPTAATPGAASPPATQNCTPRATAGNGAEAQAGASVGAGVGGTVLGGGYGRSVGAAAGALLGGLGRKKPAEPAPQPGALPPCP